MKKRFGTIDLGTNTFHLLIVEMDEHGEIRRLYKERQFVHLGEGGVGHLLPEAMQRGWATLHHFLNMLHEKQVDQFRAVGTSALREADNASEFIEKAKELGIDIEVISGLEEARLICKGVQLALGDERHRQLIMDIGGGSVEFIISKEGRIEWSGSFPLGVAVLYKLTAGEDPLEHNTIDKLVSYIRTNLESLNKALREFPPELFVGASGSFEVLDAFENNNERIHKCSYLSKDDFQVLYNELLPSTLQERLEMPAIPESRASLIVVAFILINEVLKLFNGMPWLYSPYALKEGILSEMK